MDKAQSYLHPCPAPFPTISCDALYTHVHAPHNAHADLQFMHPAYTVAITQCHSCARPPDTLPPSPLPPPPQASVAIALGVSSHGGGGQRLSEWLRSASTGHPPLPSRQDRYREMDSLARRYLDNPLQQLKEEDQTM